MRFISFKLDSARNKIARNQQDPVSAARPHETCYSLQLLPSLPHLINGDSEQDKAAPSTSDSTSDRSQLCSVSFFQIQSNICFSYMLILRVLFLLIASFLYSWPPSDPFQAMSAGRDHCLRLNAYSLFILIAIPAHVKT